MRYCYYYGKRIIDPPQPRTGGAARHAPVLRGPGGASEGAWLGRDGRVPLGDGGEAGGAGDPGRDRADLRQLPGLHHRQGRLDRAVVLLADGPTQAARHRARRGRRASRRSGQAILGKRIREIAEVRPFSTAMVALAGVAPSIRAKCSRCPPSSRTRASASRRP